MLAISTLTVVYGSIASRRRPLGVGQILIIQANLDIHGFGIGRFDYSQKFEIRDFYLDY